MHNMNDVNNMNNMSWYYNVHAMVKVNFYLLCLHQSHQSVRVLYLVLDVYVKLFSRFLSEICMSESC